MRSQKELIHEEDWDNLIILDACRFDYFEKVYEEYLDGDLVKVESEGHRTQEWLKKTWDGEYDLTYVSANPYINSVGMDWGVYWNFNPSEHFEEIEDLWESEWDECLKTVPPKNVTSCAIDQFLKNPGNRYVIHYIQPHYPFLSIGPLNRGMYIEKPYLGIRRKVANFMVRLLGNNRAVALRRSLRPIINLAKNEYEAVADEYGVDGLRRYYRENLRFVLESVSELVSKLKGVTVITSDHGDYLGEDGKFGHELLGDDFLREVPWLVVDS